MLVRGIIIEHCVDPLAGWHLTLDGTEETDEFEVAMALHATADHRAVEHAKCGEQGGSAVPLVIVGHGLAAAWLDRQTRLAVVEGLDLALLVGRKHDGVGRRIDIEADDVDELGGKAGFARVLEATQPMRLQFVRPPDALYRAQRDAGCLGHRPAGPVGRLVRRFGAEPAPAKAGVSTTNCAVVSAAIGGLPGLRVLSRSSSPQSVAASATRSAG
jgi:hypothetical protein